MLNDGFQYLEQRDATDAITHEGVVSKKSAFATSDNRGIFDVIAEDLRALYDDMSSLSMAKLKDDVQAMYDDMKSNPNFGSTAAAEQAKLALEYAERAEKALKDVQDERASVESAIAQIENVEDTLKAIQSLTARSETAATNAETSEKNAKASETAAKTSETNASSSADLAKKWAVSTESPDDADDTDSPTKKTQSSRAWALYAKKKADAAANVAKGVQKVIDDAVDVLKEEFKNKSNVFLLSDDGISPFIEQFSTADENIAMHQVYVSDSTSGKSGNLFETKGE